LGQLLASNDDISPRVNGSTSRSPTKSVITPGRIKRKPPRIKQSACNREDAGDWPVLARPCNSESLCQPPRLIKNTPRIADKIISRTFPDHPHSWDRRIQKR